MKRLGILVFCLSLVPFAVRAQNQPPAAKAAAPADAPALTIEATSQDKGRLAKGTPAEYVFTVRNTGKSELNISEVRPSCGCTVASFDKSIAAGASGSVKATIDTSRFQGPIAKTVTVKSNDPSKPEMTLTMKADIYQLVEVLPSDRAMLTTVRGESATKSFTIKSNQPDAPPLEITGVEAKIPGLSHKLIKVADGYQLDLTLAGDAPVGPLAGEVKLETNNPKVPLVTIQVSGNVRGPILVAPSAVFLPSKNAAEMAQESRIVNLRPSKEGVTFKVTDVKVGDPILKAELSEVQPGTLYTVKIGFTSPPHPGRLDSSITIITDNALQPKIEVPVKAQIREN